MTGPPGPVAVFMSRNIPADSASGSLITGGNADLLEEIRAALLSQTESSPQCQALIQLALIRMERDLKSTRRSEVIEQIQQEMDYREWSERMTAVPDLRAGQKK
jgi:hypothetical protein